MFRLNSHSYSEKLSEEKSFQQQALKNTRCKCKMQLIFVEKNLGPENSKRDLHLRNFFAYLSRQVGGYMYSLLWEEH